MLESFEFCRAEIVEYEYSVCIDRDKIFTIQFWIDHSALDNFKYPDLKTKFHARICSFELQQTKRQQIFIEYLEISKIF